MLDIVGFGVRGARGLFKHFNLQGNLWFYQSCLHYTMSKLNEIDFINLLMGLLTLWISLRNLFSYGEFVVLKVYIISTSILDPSATHKKNNYALRIMIATSSLLCFVLLLKTRGADLVSNMSLMKHKLIVNVKLSQRKLIMFCSVQLLPTFI